MNTKLEEVTKKMLKNLLPLIVILSFACGRSPIDPTTVTPTLYENSRHNGRSRAEPKGTVSQGNAQGQVWSTTFTPDTDGYDVGCTSVSPNRKIFEARKRETAALGAGEKLVLGHPLAATIGDSARCMQNLEKVLFTGPKTSDTVTFICD